ncbi:putative Rapid response to glucose protein [Gigaspora margarita]|uniref:Putative Rapid response to glucose protein n=1 Tax=Gigaspora margarita TaxID=4874 RepID=A0A8H4ADZ4_GIGMA|nr:putative Rapid response to glucose protein [Gigaspora margarita]
MLQPPLLIEGPKFSFNFELSSNSFHLSQRFVINNQPIYLYNPSEECSLDKSLNNDEPLEHTILTSTSVWDASLILAKFLEKQFYENKINFKEKNFIELGSGTSIPSVTTSILGAKQVTITDAPSVIPQIKNIIKLNSLLKKPVNVESLDWVNGKENLETLKNGRWDYILGSDIVWVDHLIKPLIETIDVLSTPSYTKLLISHQSRTVRCDNLFFNGLKDLGWKLDKISHDELNWEEGFLKDGVEIYYGYKE